MAEIVVSRRTFLIGLIVAILAASAISTVISTQWARGPQGPIGSQGEQGDRGLQGIQGERGPQGMQGQQGLQGETGDTGPQGLQGEQGPEGSPCVFTLENMSGWLPAPAYDSGWVGPLRAQASSEFMLHHGLNTTNVLVYLIADMPSDWLHIHQRRFGDTSSGQGMMWGNLTNNDITVWVANSFPPSYEYIRVQMWKIAQP